MIGELKIGEYRILDSSYYQYPSITVFKILDIQDKDVLIKKVIYVCKRDPHNGLNDFDEYMADRNFAIISNSAPLNEANRIKAIQLLFSRQWDYYG